MTLEFYLTDLDVKAAEFNAREAAHLAQVKANGDKRRANNLAMFGEPTQ